MKRAVVCLAVCAALAAPLQGQGTRGTASGSQAKPAAKPASGPTAKQPSSPASKASKPHNANPSHAQQSRERAQAELERLCRVLRDKDTPQNYERLAEFARRHEPETPGARAALALGYRDFSKNRYALALPWFRAAAQDELLAEYASYWTGLTLRELGRGLDALAQLERHRRSYPQSVMAAQVVEALAAVALAEGEYQMAASALDGFAGTASRPSLLILRGRSREAAGRAMDAVADYQAVYFDFPLSPDAETAEKRLDALRKILGVAQLDVPPARRLARAEALYAAKKCTAALPEFAGVAPLLAAAERERAQLRVAQCRAPASVRLEALARLQFTDAEVDAERLYALSQEWRSARNETEMLAAVERAVERAPQSRWADEALFSAGNYFWVKLDRGRAAEFYRRDLTAFPVGPNARNAQWRAAWASYLDRAPDAAAQMEEHLRRFPGSSMTANALYWLGRAAERSGDVPRARGYYLHLRQRLPQTYFGMQAMERLRSIGAAPVATPEILAQIPAPAPAPELDAIPAAAGLRWQRALALRSIAFDASAELELRAAYQETRSPRMLLEAAKSALDAERFFPAVATARQAYPELEARRWEDVPNDVWSTVYPVVYEELIEKHAKRNGLDPALVAGLIRQESVFQKDAVSRAGALGLMQVLPRTGQQLARREKVAYARVRLFDPEYNLRLGTVYFKQKIAQLGSVEAALAAYNAGEDRVALWRQEREFAEMAEFVESIPFTETREYVQIVTRNAEIYRRLYAQSQRARLE